MAQYLQRNPGTGQLEHVPGNPTEQFQTLMANAYLELRLSRMWETALDADLGEIRISDFQWLTAQNQWRQSNDETIAVRVRMQTVGGREGMAFYMTDSVSGRQAGSGTFTMPSDVFLPATQLMMFVWTLQGDDTFLTNAANIAVDASRRSAR